MNAALLAAASVLPPASFEVGTAAGTATPASVSYSQIWSTRRSAFHVLGTLL